MERLAGSLADPPSALQYQRRLPPRTRDPRLPRVRSRIQPPEPTSRRRRILHIAPVPAVPDGGIAAYALGLLNASVAGPYEMRAVDVSVPSLYRRHRGLRPWLTMIFLVRLWAALRRFRPDLVHIHTTNHVGFWEKSFLAQCARASGTPYLMHLHGGLFEPFLKGLGRTGRWFAGRSLRGAARVILLTHAWRPLLHPFVEDSRIAVLPNAIRCADFAVGRRPPTARPRLLLLSMISARKGLDELRQALLALRGQDGLECDVDIVGDEEVPGALRYYQDLYRRAGLDAWVRFHGPAYGEAKLEFLRRATIFVLPTRFESFGIANLEAMAAGLPVLTTRTGAIPDYLVDGVHGLLVDPGDADALARALRRLLDDAALRSRLGSAARERARAYDWETLAGTLQAIYGSVLDERSATPDTG